MTKERTKDHVGRVLDSLFRVTNLLDEQTPGELPEKVVKSMMADLQSMVMTSLNLLMKLENTLNEDRI